MTRAPAVDPGADRILRPGRVPRSVHPNALLLVLCAATFMGSLDLFIVNVGLSDIGRAVDVRSLAGLSWVLNAYAIVFAALLVPAGRFADRYGNKTIFVAGLAVFGGASLGCALSGELWQIVVLRCLQGAGAAAITPASLGLILTAIPAHRRAHSIRLWAVSGSLGAAAGPAMGGLLVQLSWRWIFLVNVPIALGSLVAAVALAPRVRHSSDTGVPDLVGGGLLIVANGALTLALVRGSDWGWAGAWTLTGFAVSLLGFALFAWRSTRHPAPVVDLRLFTHRAFAWANLSMLFFSVAFGAQLLGLVLWLQHGWHWSPLQTGLGIAPGPVMVSVTALGLRRLTTRLPQGLVAAGGTFLLGAGSVLVGLSVNASPNYATGVLPGWLIGGAGVGLAIPTIVGIATADLAPHETSTGSAVVQMSRQLGSVLGVAGLVIVLGASLDTTHLLHRLPVALTGAGMFALVATVAAMLVSVHRPAPARALSPEAP